MSPRVGKKCLIFLSSLIMIMTIFAMIAPFWVSTFGLFFTLFYNGSMGAAAVTLENAVCASPGFDGSAHGVKCGSIYAVIFFTVLASVMSIVVLGLLISKSWMRHRKIVLGAIIVHFVLSLLSVILFTSTVLFWIGSNSGNDSDPFGACWCLMIAVCILDLCLMRLVWKYDDQSIEDANVVNYNISMAPLTAYQREQV